MHISRFGRRIFNLIARLTSYSTAVAGTSAGVSAPVVLVYVLAFTNSTLQALPPFVITMVIITTAVVFTFHGIQFGIFNKLGFSGLGVVVKSLNKNIKCDKNTKDLYIADNLSAAEYKTLLRALTRISLQNSLTTSFYGLIMIFLFNTVYYLNRGDYNISSNEALTGVLFIFVAGLIGIFLNAFLSYALGELGTGRMRSRCKQIMVEKKIDFKDKAVLSVKTKFILFAVLLIVTIYVSNTLTFSLVNKITESSQVKKNIQQKKITEEKKELKSGTTNLAPAKLFSKLPFFSKIKKLQPVFLFVGFAILVTFLMAYIMMHTIIISLDEIRDSLTDLKNGGEGNLFPRSLDKEFITLAIGVVSAAKKIKDYQYGLEEKVAVRTRELSKVNTSLQEKDQIVQTELSVAKDIQEGIIPHEFPKWNGLKFAYEYIPMETVSGDYLDVFSLPGGNLGLLIADVSGHGIPAALITTMAKVSFEKATLNSGSPAKIFKEVNTQIITHVKTQDYLTAFFISIDKNHNITYSNASHQMAKILRYKDASIINLDSGGLFIGALEDAGPSYEDKTEKIYPGDRIILYTDGIPERKNMAGEDYGHDRFEALLIQTKDMLIDEAKEFIMGEIHKFSEGVSKDDDITIFLIELDPQWAEFLEHSKKAKTFLESRKLDLAIKHYEAAMEIFPYHPETLLDLATLYTELTKNSEAKEMLFRYEKLNPSNADCYLLLGYLFSIEEDFAKSKMYLTKAVNIRPNFAEAMLNLSTVLVNLKEYAEAEIYLQKCLKLDPENTGIKARLEDIQAVQAS